MSPAGSRQSCREALMRFEAKRFDEWQPIATACLTELQARWRIADAGMLNAPLGSERKTTTYDYYQVAGYAQPVRVWHEYAKLLQIDADATAMEQAAVLLNALGAPEARLDTQYGYALLQQAEWFYGERGLSLLVLAGDDVIEAVAVFPPTTLAHYLEYLRVDRAAHPLPKGERA